jgi:hypothetical protein
MFKPREKIEEMNLRLPYYEAADAALVLGLVASRPRYLGYSLSPPGGLEATPYFSRPSFQTAVGTICEETLFEEDGILRWLSFPKEEIGEIDVQEIQEPVESSLVRRHLQALDGAESSEGGASSEMDVEPEEPETAAQPQVVEEVEVGSSYAKSFYNSFTGGDGDTLPSYLVTGSRAANLLMILELLGDKQFVDPISTQTGIAAGEAISCGRNRVQSAQFEVFERELRQPLIDSFEMGQAVTTHMGYSSEAKLLSMYVGAGQRMWKSSVKGNYSTSMEVIKSLMKEANRREPATDSGSFWSRLKGSVLGFGVDVVEF